MRVFVFIDLDSARRIKRPAWRAGTERDVSWAFRKIMVTDLFSTLQDRISALVSSVVGSSPVQVVATRLYHGWHRGSTATDDYRLWKDARTSFTAHRYKQVVYLPDVYFGNELLCGGERMPLYDTLRRGDDGTDRQKMVDSAIIADLLQLTRSESANFKKGKKPDSLALIVADDDDLIPGAFVAESWGMPTRIVRVNRAAESAFLKLKNMVEHL